MSQTRRRPRWLRRDDREARLAGTSSRRSLTAEEFDALYERLRRSAVCGPDDRRGALNHITSDRVLAAVREVRLGRTASLGAPVEGEITADNPEPAVHEMTGLPTGENADPPGLSFAMDRLAMNVHGNADSHIDALCHVIYRAHLYDGVPADRITASGATELSIDVACDGIVGRGLLLDIPRLRGVEWLEPGDHVTSNEPNASRSRPCPGS